MLSAMMKVAGTMSRRCCLPPKLIMILEEHQLRIIIRMQGVLTIISMLLRTYCSILGRSTFSSSLLRLSSLSSSVTGSREAGSSKSSFEGPCKG